jgi:hypothetical protein
VVGFVFRFYVWFGMVLWFVGNVLNLFVFNCFVKG